jgi:hypothetical protein
MTAILWTNCRSLIHFRGDGVVEDFPGNILILEPMKTVQRLHKRRKQSRKERLETKQPDWKFDFQRAKEYQKIEKKSRI